MIRRAIRLFAILAALVATPAFAIEDDYQFLPGYATGGIGSSGDSEATSRLVLGYPGQSATPGKNRWLEPVDGNGGFDNVAPRLSVEPGPGGLEWDLSPSYRTRYKNGTDYTNSTTNPQGNNWFASLPYLEYNGSNQYSVRFGANEFFIYDKSGSFYYGTYANAGSYLATSSPLVLYDAAGKQFSFDASTLRLTKIDGIGDAEITLTYNGTSSITVTQKSDSSTEVRRFVYTLEASGTRIDKIDVELYDGMSWTGYRTVDFTYHDNVMGATGSSSGDLIAIEDTKDLSESGKSYTRTWVFKYYTGTYDSSTNPGNPYQVEAVYGPGSIQSYLADNSMNDLEDFLTSSASSVSSYAERSYEYASDRRVREISFEDGCGCGGATGTFEYTWATNGTTPSDLNTWNASVTIERPDGSAQMIDYNLFGQTLNSVVQEDATDSGSRRWIRTWRYDSAGRLTDSYSVASCSSYNTSTHAVTTTSGGMHYKYSYHSTHGYLETTKLVDPSTSNENYVQKLGWTKKTSGQRKRFILTSSTVYPTATTTDTGGIATSHSYAYHTADTLAVKKRTSTLPTISTAENGKGTAYTTKQYWELDGLATWSRDAELYIHYTGYDADRRVPTVQVTDIDTDTADRPSGVPAAPDSEFESSDGLNLVTRMEYDALGRQTKREGPEFNAFDSSIVATKTTGRTHYSKLLDDSLVVVSYPHIDSSYHHAAVSISVLDHDGNAVTSALGELDSLTRDTDLDDDIDETKSTLSAAFDGEIIQRTDSVYDGGKLASTSVWTDADNGSAAKHTSSRSYDASGRLETETTPAGTITHYYHDVLGRVIERRVGTVDGGMSDNMTKVEELFYDGEEDDPENVGDGFLTRRVLYTSYTTETDHPTRTTDTSYDYRGRVTKVKEPLDIYQRPTYDFLGRMTRSERFDGDPDMSGTLLSKSETDYDAWGQSYRSKIYGITGGSGTGYAKTETWRDGRGLVVKTLSQGKVFQKSIYDGAGRVTTSAVCYDTDESTYAEADDLSGDTVVEESRTVYDAAGRAELVGHYQRRHNGANTGALTVGSSGNARAQYTANWYDRFGRAVSRVSYGTNGGTDLSARPSGSPPEYSSDTELVARHEYTIKGQSSDQIQAGTEPPVSPTPTAHELWVGINGTARRTTYTDWGATASEIENYVDGTPGTTDDRTLEYVYDSVGRLSTRTAKASVADQTTTYTYGVTRGAGATNSRLSSNDLAVYAEYPGGGLDETEKYSCNAQGELIYKVFANPGSEHVYAYDARGRQTLDKVTGVGTSVDNWVLRIERSYDALDRVEKVTSYDAATSGSVVNEVQYEYGKFGVVEALYQNPAGAVNTSTSPKVDYAWNFPTDGTTPLRLSSTTHPDTTSIYELYSSTTDDVLSRPTAREVGTDTLFTESYLGLGRLVEREYGATGVTWTLVGTDSPNNDNLVGLDRHGRIDDLIVKDSSSNLVRYLYSYNERSQITIREDKVSNVYSYEIFDELYTYDELGRLTDLQRGDWDGSSLTSIQLHECWTLDRSSNRTGYYNGTASSCGTPSTLAFNVSNEITSSGYAHADSGALTDKPGSEDFVYDAWDRMVSRTVGADTVEYEYNGLNWKTKRTGDSTLVDTFYYYQPVEKRISLLIPDLAPTFTAVDFVEAPQRIDLGHLSVLSCGSTKSNGEVR